MLAFYLTLIGMLLAALILVMIPFVRTNKYFTRQSSFAVIFTTLLACILYFIFGNAPGLNQWLTAGKKHYQLLTEVNQLGGMDTIIARIQQRLKLNPDDIRGWIILGKIFLSEGRIKEARDALDHAKKINPNDAEVRTLSQKLP